MEMGHIGSRPSMFRLRKRSSLDSAGGASIGGGTAHVQVIATPEPEKPGEADEAKQAQVKTPVIVVRVSWRTADILGRSLCRGANACDGDEEERAEQRRPEEIQTHIEPSHDERV